MSTTVFLDEFVGGAGNLTGHTPDIASPVATWVTIDLAINLSGSGYARPSTTAGTCQAEIVSTGGDTLGAYFSVELDAFINSSFSTSNLAWFDIYDAGVDFIANIKLEDDGVSGLLAKLTAYDALGASYAFANVALAVGAHTLRAAFSNADVSFYVDEVLQETQTMAVAAATSTYRKVFTTVRQGGSDTKVGTTRLAVIANVPPVFWTGFVGTFEIP